MPLIEGEVTIVLAGAWNRAIFTPAWVHQKLFAEGDEILVDLLFGESPGLRFQSQGITLMVLPGRVQITPTQTDDDGLARAERAAVKLLTSLPETPMQARGINVVHKAPEPGAYAALFCDPPLVPTERVPDIEARRVGWKFRDGDDEVNVQAEIAAGGVSISFNFHRAGQTTAALRDGLTGSVRSSVLRADEITRWMGRPAVEVTA